MAPDRSASRHAARSARYRSTQRAERSSPCRRSGGGGTSRRRLAHDVEHGARGRPRVARQPLVCDRERLDAVGREPRRPGRVLLGQAPLEVGDGAAVVGLGGGLPAVLGAPGPRLHRAPQGDGLGHLVLAGDVHPPQARQPLREQARVAPVQPIGEIEEMRPHQLRPEHAVGRRPAPERGGDRVAAVGAARLGRGEPREHLRVRHVLEVLPGLARHAASPQALEKLARVPGNAGALEQRAQQRAPAAGCRAHQE